MIPLDDFIEVGMSDLRHSRKAVNFRQILTACSFHSQKHIVVLTLQ
jgi:hypothetical protein